MNKKQIFLSICLFIVFFSLLSVASASDTTENVTVTAVSDDSNTISVTNNQDHNLGASPGFTSLNTTISDSQAGESITLNEDYSYSDSDGDFSEGIIIDKSITIDGQGYMIDAKEKESIFNIQGNSKVILKNIKFVNAYGVNGSAIKLDPSTHLEIIDCEFNNNVAQMCGAAIYVSNSSSLTSNLIINGSKFNSNSANLGGAIYLTENSHDLSVIEDSIFINCTSTGDGGAAYISADNVELKNVVFQDNVAGDDGGAVYWEGDNGILMDITCINNKGISATKSDGINTSSTRGGTIIITGSNITVSNSKFINGSAYMDAGKDSTKVDGGALFVTGNYVTIKNNTFEQCKAVNNGGAVYVIGNNTEITECVFGENTGLDGAALYVEGHDCKVSDSTFKDNTAGDDGGAIYWEGDNGYIFNITCINNKGISATKPDGVNTSSTRGGTLSIIGNNVTVEKSTFNSSQAYMDVDKDNSRVDGGAIFITGNDINILESAFNDCTAVHSGGAIHIIGNNTNVLDCTFENTQALLGGAIFIDGNYIIVDNSLFRHNKGSDKGETGGTGGAIYVQGTGATISNSDFAYGDAINYGGAIAVWGANANITKNVFDNCTTKLYEGGAIYVNGVNATISLSNFTRNIAKGEFRGGAIQVSGDKTSILDCNFDSCYAKFGGIIYIGGADAFINNSNFKHSVAYNKNYPVDGGAICVKGYNTIISNSNFSDLTSSHFGGAIYIDDGVNTNIIASNFDTCKATEGGAIYVFGNLANIENSTFISSSANNGGAIHLDAWGATIKGSNITDCVADSNGGAIHVAGGGANIVKSNFENCLAKGSSASNGGGAIYIDGPDTHITTSNFNNNKVDSKSYGGTIYIKGLGTIIETSIFNGSSANQGGVIYIEGEKAIISTSTFANSSSSTMGGAISVNGHNATIYGSDFENIVANSNGGAIYVKGEDTDILYSSFDNCVAKSQGGAIYINDKDTTVAYSNFTSGNANVAGAIAINGVNTEISYCNLDNNTASSAGAIKVFGNYTTISNCNFTYNNATHTSGGALDIGGSNASVLYSWFDHNDAKTNGGAINWIGGHGDDSILGSTFTNNGCHDEKNGGGAIFWTASNEDNIGSGGLILNSIFINNTAYGHHGGAIDWFHALDSTINNCLFINNTANSDGGALYTGDQNGKGHNLMMSNCQFYNNTAGKHGGAIANQMSDSWIYNNTFDGNRAKASGGTILMKEGYADNSVIDHCYIYNSFIDQNYIKDGKYQTQFGVGGAAIRIGGSDNNITISNCAVINSTANKTWGGAISIDGGNEGTSLINVTIQNTHVLDGYGGAIVWKGNYGTLNNVTIFNSSATIVNDANAYVFNDKSANGGAIYLSGSNCNLTDIRIFESSTNKNNKSATKSNNGGAVYVSGTSNIITNIEIDDSSALSERLDAKGGAIYWEGKTGTLINATISNTLANGQGGAIYWSGSSPVIENISIEYSQTNVTNSSNSADGGAIYSTGINDLNNVYITDAIAYRDNGNVKGGAIYYTGANMNNVTVLKSRASTDNGTSYGGAIYWEGKSNPNLYNSSFEENHADLGGAIYTVRTTKIYDTSFTGNVAEDGGAIYATSNDVTLNGTSFESNSAKRGGAIFTNNVQIKMYNSTLSNNTAEESGAALYHNYVNKAGSEIVDTDIVNNTAYRGSAIYATNFNNFALKNVVLLDNQANANKFINKTIGVYNDTYNYTSAIFLGNDNLLNSIWLQGNRLGLSCTNVTYLGTNGISVTNETPVKSNQEVRQNVTIYMFDKKGELIDQQDLITDGSGKVVYTFKAEKGEIYNFAYEHKNDRYYTYLRDTSSNSSLVQIWINNCTYGENASALISLTDGAWGNLSGNVTVEINDTKHTTFTVEIINSTLTYYNITGLPVGHYKATATFKGNSTRLGDTDWGLFVVRPYTDLNITKDVNVTGDFVNVTDYIMYTINVTNKGPTESWDVNVTEILTPYLKLIDSTASKGYYNYTNGTWFIGDLAVNENVSLIIKAQVIHKGLIANNVWVDGAGREANFTDNVASARNLTAVAYVDLRIVKERNVSEVLAIGDRIKYVITVFNDGPCNATGVYVGENLDARLKLISSVASVGKYENGTWNIGELNEGANATLTIEAEVRYSGVILNKVNVTTYDNDTNLTNNFANVTNLAVANVDLQITKKANVTGTVAIGDRIKFTVSVYNDGPCNATGVYVGEEIKYPLRFISSDVTIGRYQDATWVIGNLNKGEVHNLTIIAEVVASGDISNYVFVKGSDNDTNLTNNEYNLTNITAASFVDLVIDKEVTRADVVYVNDTVVFTIRVHNRGDLDATGVNVTEEWNTHLQFEESSTQNGYYNETERIWYIGTLAKKSDATLTIKARVMSNGTISNVVVVKSREKDINESNNRDEIDNFTALPIVDLDIQKRAITIPARDTVYVGDEITFAIDVHNGGPCTATGVVVSENVTGLVEIISFNPSVGTSYDPKTGIWTIGTLESGGNAGLFINVKVKSNGTVANFVSVKGNEKDTNTSNNNASSDNITALPLVDVKVNKTVSATEVKVGDNIVYTIKVQNNGPNDATNVNVTGKLSNNVVYISSAASQGSYDAAKNIWYIGKLTNSSIATMTLTVQAAEVGTVENSVIVNSTEKDRNTSNNNYTCDNVTVTKLDTPIELVTYNITYGEDEILVVRLPEKVTGTVNITVADRTYNNVPINNGIVELPVTDLAGGDYDVTVVYGGDDKYLPNSTSGKFNVAKLTPKITIQVEDIWVWEIEVLNVTVNAPGTVFVTVNGITVEIPLENGVVTTDVLKAAKLDYNGRATWNIIHLPVGTYPAYAMYPGNENYTSVDTSDVFHVKDRIPTTIVIVPSNIYVGDDEFMEIYVGPSGVTGSVIVNVEGVNYTCPLENGYAILTIPDLKAGVKDVTAWYNGNELYLPSENISSFEVWKIKPPVDVEAPEITVGEDGVIIVTVPDDATGEITIEINGERHTAIIQFGQAVFIIPGLEVGVHDILAFYSGDDKYLPANTTGKIKVNPKDEPDDDNKTHKHPSKKSTIDNKMPATGNPLMALIVVLMSIFLVQVRRFKK